MASPVGIEPTISGFKDRSFTTQLQGDDEYSLHDKPTALQPLFLTFDNPVWNIIF